MHDSGANACDCAAADPVNRLDLRGTKLVHRTRTVCGAYDYIVEIVV